MVHTTIGATMDYESHILKRIEYYRFFISTAEKQIVSLIQSNNYRVEDIDKQLNIIKDNKANLKSHEDTMRLAFQQY
jgi:hypothetical protein